MVRVALLSILAIVPAQAEVYCFGFLNSHPERKQIPQAEAEEIQKAHLAHMEKMAFAGRLLAAGPMATPGGPRGASFFIAASRLKRPRVGRRSIRLSPTNGSRPSFTAGARRTASPSR